MDIMSSSNGHYELVHDDLRLMTAEVLNLHVQKIKANHTVIAEARDKGMIGLKDALDVKTTIIIARFLRWPKSWSVKVFFCSSCTLATTIGLAFSVHDLLFCRALLLRSRDPD